MLQRFIAVHRQCSHRFKGVPEYVQADRGESVRPPCPGNSSLTTSTDTMSSIAHTPPTAAHTCFGFALVCSLQTQHDEMR